jgi:biotin carboxyl carrier protein
MKKNKDQEHEKDKLKLLNVDYFKYRTRLTTKYTKRKPYQAADPRMVLAFIPGTIRKINVKEGEKVKEGDLLLTLEAMKMKNKILSPLSGKVKSVNVKQGNIVAKNDILIELE